MRGGPGMGPPLLHAAGAVRGIADDYFSSGTITSLAQSHISLPFKCHVVGGRGTDGNDQLVFGYDRNELTGEPSSNPGGVAVLIDVKPPQEAVLRAQLAWGHRPVDPICRQYPLPMRVGLLLPGCHGIGSRSGRESQSPPLSVQRSASGVKGSGRSR